MWITADESWVSFVNAEAKELNMCWICSRCHVLIIEVLSFFLMSIWHCCKTSFYVTAGINSKKYPVFWGRTSVYFLIKVNEK
jgi:hypothetical protein